MKNKYKYELVKYITFFFRMFVLRKINETINVEAESKQAADAYIVFHYPEYEVKASWQIRF